MFEKISDKMMARVHEDNIQQAIEILQNKHSLSIQVPRHQIKVIEKEIVRINNRKKIELPPKENNNQVNILELEAEALMLELELA